jgi:hypothetical protein
MKFLCTKTLYKSNKVWRNRRSWDSSVVQRWATGWTISDLSPVRGWEFFSTPTDSGAHPASYPVGTRVLSLGVKQPGHEADYSPPSNAEDKNS